MKSIDEYLDRVRHPGYDCWNFAVEVWIGLTGENATDRIKALLLALGERHVLGSAVKGFKRIEQPESPCFVVMQSPKIQPHIGVWLQGRVLHLAEVGVEFQTLQQAKRYFHTARFYK